MKILVMMPTYNEIETIETSVEKLFTYNPEVDLLIIDDNSPDGTGALANHLSTENSRIQVLHRSGKEGLGQAYIAGYRYGISHNYDMLVQMDADGSHRAEDLKHLIAAASSFDLVIGSRWIPGGAVSNWPWYRQGISQAGNWYASKALGLNINDTTAGFRVYRSSLLQRIDLDQIRAQGYGFQVEMTLRSQQLGAEICEVPILFIERENGRSKMTLAIVLEAFVLATKWGIERLIRR